MVMCMSLNHATLTRVLLSFAYLDGRWVNHTCLTYLLIRTGLHKETQFTIPPHLDYTNHSIFNM
jgi:hypothetical protein